VTAKGRVTGNVDTENSKLAFGCEDLELVSDPEDPAHPMRRASSTRTPRTDVTGTSCAAANTRS
jgi:hypothetical protein